MIPFNTPEIQELSLVIHKVRRTFHYATCRTSVKDGTRGILMMCQVIDFQACVNDRISINPGVDNEVVCTRMVIVLRFGSIWFVCTIGVARLPQVSS